MILPMSENIGIDTKIMLLDDLELIIVKYDYFIDYVAAILKFQDGRHT